MRDLFELFKLGLAETQGLLCNELIVSDMISTFSLLFSLKKGKILTTGKAPIYIRLTVNGPRIEFTTKRYVEPEQWNPAAQKMRGTHEEARKFNRYLKTMEHIAYDAHSQMVEHGITVTANGLRDKILGREEHDPVRTLMPIFEEHNKRIEALVGKEYALGTLERYRTSLKHTRDFLFWQYNLKDIDIEKIDHEFVTSYDFYLRSQKNCCNNSTVKYLKNFKKIIRICISNGWLSKDPFAAHRSRIDEVIPSFLTAEELMLIYKKEFSSERICQVRDIFLFSCYTGLAYADVKKLKRDEIVKGIDGQQWIFTSRQKTETASRIPLLPMALDIMDRYVDNPQCLYEDRLLPVLSNQKMNSYLKEIADLCGIHKPFSYHTARHTFATTVTLSNGVPLESISKMLGHKNIRTTQHYARILDIKVSEDMQKLMQKLKG